MFPVTGADDQRVEVSCAGLLQGQQQDRAVSRCRVEIMTFQCRAQPGPEFRPVQGESGMPRGLVQQVPFVEDAPACRVGIEGVPHTQCLQACAQAFKQARRRCRFAPDESA